MGNINDMSALTGGRITKVNGEAESVAPGGNNAPTQTPQVVLPGVVQQQLPAPPLQPQLHPTAQASAAMAAVPQLVNGGWQGRPNWDNLPAEMRSLNQWAIAAPDKAPKQIDGTAASSADPGTWTTHEIACGHAYNNGRHIGFMHLADNGIATIDLDIKDADNEPDPKKWTTDASIARFNYIIEWAMTDGAYIERSRSGKGVHIIGLGKLPNNKGRKRDGVEIYTDKRFMIATGNTVTTPPAQLQSLQDIIDELVNHMPAVRDDGGEQLLDVEETLSSEEIYEKLAAQSNSEKFLDLWTGNWSKQGYSSQSRADNALMDFFLFAGATNAQGLELFQISNLAPCKRVPPSKQKSDPADYMQRTLRAVRNQLANDAEKVAIGELIANRLLRSNPNDSTFTGIDEAETNLPPICSELINLPYGLGLIQDFIYNQMIYPDRASAGFTALALFSSYVMPFKTVDSFSGLGLNEYYFNLAATASGKEALLRAIGTINKGLGFKDNLTAIIRSLPASAQGLHKQLETNPNLFLVVDEASEWLVSTKQDRYKQEALGYAMEIYTKAKSSVNVPITAGEKYSPVDNPRLSMFLASTPSRVFEAMTSSHANSGSYNRFNFFLAPQERIAKRYSGQVYEPSTECLNVFKTAIESNVHNIAFQPDAWQHFMEYDSEVIEPLKFADNTFAGRLSEQVLKAAALIAMSNGRFEIAVSDLQTAYAIRVNLYQRFKTALRLNGGLDDMHETGKAIVQLRSAFSNHKFIYQSHLENHSRIYKKLETYKRESVLRALEMEGTAKREGKRFLSLICTK